MKTPYLLGIITALLFGSFALSGFLAEAGPNPNDIMVVHDPITNIYSNTIHPLGIATCPMTHQIIGGGISNWFHPSTSSNFIRGDDLNLATNSYEISMASTGAAGNFRVFAICQKINFPMMGMIGGEILDLDTMSLFIGAIGVNPVITGLVAITMGGVAAQAIWFVNSRRVKKIE